MLMCVVLCFIFKDLDFCILKDEYLINLTTQCFLSIFSFAGHGGVNQLGGVFVNGKYFSI